MIALAAADLIEAADPDTGVRVVHRVVRDRQLDRLRHDGWVSQFQYDAGVKLWEIYREADVRLGVRAANLEVSAGRGQQAAIGNAAAYAEYLRCLRLVHVSGRGVVIAVCIHDMSISQYARQYTASPGVMIALLQAGLGRLAREFSNEP